MKKSITVFFIGLISVFLLTDYSYAQPEGFMYQAEIRNDKGRTLSNTSISLDIRILDQMDDVNSLVWQRIYNVTTDKFGMVSVIVGDEDPTADQSKLFKDIAWGSVNHYLYIELNDGSGWVSMGDPVMLMSVPYALYAKSAGSAKDPEFSSSPAAQITQQDIIEWNENSYNNLNFFYADRDGDGFGDKWNIVFSDAPPHAGYISNGDDCNDEDASIHPGADEIPEDGIDQNCDGSETYLDKDNDGYTSDVDCDDNNANVYPGADEICWDGIDNNCDGYLDEGCELDCRVELIGLFDCVDEYCGGLADLSCIQDNCGRYMTTYNLCVDMACVIELSGSIDETWTSAEKADYILASCSKEDFDNDGVSISEGDCNDNDATVYPGATEICEDGIDQNCNGRDAPCTDADKDGYSPAMGDCDDNNANVYPGAEEVCDDADNDCDGEIDNVADNPNAREYTYYEDADEDGFGNPEVFEITCNPPTGYVQNGDDCDDTDADKFPGQIWYADCDNDGHFSNNGITSCDEPTSCVDGQVPEGGYIHTPGDDCDDEDATVHPGADEICGNSVDDNCDGQVDEGFNLDTDVNNCGACGEICGPVWAWMCVAGQCEALDNDNDGVPNILEDVNGNNDPTDDDTDGDGIANIEDDDDDGDGLMTWQEVNFNEYGVPADYDNDGIPDYLDVDSDNDGYKAGGLDVPGEEIDCVDVDETINPGATEKCDGIDNDCDGLVDEGCTDLDGDSYRGIDGDCNDNDATVYPGAPEICDGKDNNCNTVIDDIDPLINTCYSSVNLGRISGDTGSPNISRLGNGDKWFWITVGEDDQSIFSPVNLKLKCNLTFSNEVDYDIELYSACGEAILTESANSTPGITESVNYTWNDLLGSNESTEVFIHIKFAGGSACAPWSLQILGNQ